MSNEEIVRRYVRAVADRDAATAEGLRHELWAASIPQTGERATSTEGLWALLDQADAGPGEIGADGASLTAAGRLVHVEGDGDAWSAERLTRGRDGGERFILSLITIEDGLVRRERIYLADRFEPGQRRPAVDVDHGSMRPDDPLRDRIG
jgi:hypothetical protein